MAGELTREAVLVMPAGPELDALVAERVLGWVRHRSKLESGRWSLFPPGEAPDWMVPATDGAGPPITSWEPYSADMTAAWRVVAHLHSRRFSAAVSLDVDHTQGDAFAYFRGQAPRRRGRDPEGSARAATAPLAICRAALLTTLEERADG